MNEETKALESPDNRAEHIEVQFKVPEPLYLALQTEVRSNGYRGGLMNYYLYLCQAEYKQSYQNYFDLVGEEAEPKQGSLEMNDLPNFGLDASLYSKVMQAKYARSPLHANKVLSIYLEVAQFIGNCLGSDQSPIIIFRNLTEKIVIQKLVTRIKEYI